MKQNRRPFLPRTWIAILLLLTPVISIAQSTPDTMTVIIDTTFIYPGSISPQDVQKRSQMTAQQLAIQQAIPERIQITSLLTDVMQESSKRAAEHTAYSSFLYSTQEGYIVRRQLLTDNLEFKKNQFAHHLRMKAWVVPVTGERDPSLDLSLQVNRNNLRTGEEIIMTVESTQGGYLYLFQFLQDQSVVLLFPNSLMKGNTIDANTPITIPSKSQRERGIHFRVSVSPKTDISTETIYAVICK